MGAILETPSGFRGMQIFSLVAILAGAASMGVARYVLGKKAPNWKV